MVTLYRPSTTVKQGDQMKAELTFWRSRQTRNKVVYEEERMRGKPPIIGAVYVSKEWLDAVGNPDEITVTLASGDDV